MPSSTAKRPKDRKPRKTTRKAGRTESPSSEATAIPVPEDPNSKYAPQSWGNGGIGGMEDLRVPSGQLCLVRRPGLEGLMKSGVLHNVDSLTQIVNEKHLERVAGRGSKEAEINVNSLMNDPQALEDVTRIVDKVVAYCVVKPEIHRAPNDVTRREKGVIYTDMVELTDKMFIFNFVVGGTRDLESFRSGLGASVGSLDAGEDVSDEA